MSKSRQFITNPVGFTGGQHDLFMIDRIYETFSLARATGGLVGEFNRAE